MALSPESPDRLKALQEASGKDLRLLSDPGLAFSREMGIVFSMDAETTKRYEGFGVPLTKVSDVDGALMPVPAIFIVDKDGKIRFQYVDPDFSRRIDPQLLLAAAKAAKSK